MTRHADVPLPDDVGRELESAVIPDNVNRE